jgi:hypothetical protein
MMLAIFARERGTRDRLVVGVVAGVRLCLNGGLWRMLGGDTGAPPSTSVRPGVRQRPCPEPLAAKCCGNFGDDAVMFCTPYFIIIYKIVICFEFY